MVKARVLGALGVLALCAAAALTAAASATASTTAPDPPGTMSYFDLARKDCVGTARNTTSKVWFTVADGVLSDTYWPTIDATNVHTLQYLVTDGHTFTDLQTRDMTYKVLPDPTGMSCTVVASDAAHGYRIITTYITDPGRDAVLMRTSFYGPRGDQLYVRLDPLAGGTGGGTLPNPTSPENAGGNSAELADFDGQTVPVDYNTNTMTDAVNRNYAVPTYMALESSSGFSSESVGYAGTPSDGLTMLDGAHALTTYSQAPDGHVTLTAGVVLPRNHTMNLALGFGQSENQALSVAQASVNQNFDRVWADYEQGWRRYDAALRRPARWLGPAAIREYYESVNVVKASEDKTFPGAIAAGLASPWGQSVPAGEFASDGNPTYFGSYREEFSRDTYEAFTGLLVAGDIQTAQAATKFLFDKQQLPNGSMPRNSLPNGEAAPDTGGLQLDETSYPILMDWQSGLARDKSLYENHVIPAADFLVANGPSDGVERWEEQSGYSPSTIAAEIAGLTAAAAIARANLDPTHAEIYQATADDFARNIKAWTVTTNSPFYPGVGPYFIRVSKTGDPNANTSYMLNNGNTTSVDQRQVIDAGFLDLVRLGVLPANDPDVQNSIKVVDDTIERQTPSGIGFYRYGFLNSGDFSEDGYGDCYNPDSPPAAAGPNQDPTNCAPSGAPWPPTDTGTGHLWPVLSGERGEYEIAAGDFGFAGRLLTSMRNMTSGQGLEPEQVWEDPDLAASPYGSDPATASIGFTDGKPAGSASPLTWAQAQYARLALDLSAGRDLETPRIVSDRYVRHGMPGALMVTVTSPTNGAQVDTSTETVTGTTTPGATVVAEAWPSTGGAAPIASTTASTMTSTSGDWTLTVPVSFGTTTITVTATLGRSTGYSQLSVTNTALPGTTVLNVSHPSGMDNGPGTYQYPTDSVFVPGAFDLTNLQVNQDGTNVYIQVKITNLVNTFGSDFGAQLLDVYVRNPAATSTSTSSAYPSVMNYSIAPADAWSEWLEAQGFAPVVWENPSGASLGAAQLVVDDSINGSSGTATLIVPQSAFGTIGPGWVFTVALTGQGSGTPPVRGFTSTPGQYTFGVCASGNTNLICSQSPNSVPNVMDTITPPGVSQDAELDPLTPPVELQGVTVP
ncbi:MAG TPA: glucodextranase DOMON-like domain-containing protein [Solirubrobacteraceae bacterium]|nr:glucodextranase DOMON-like domain-containing protein [Solirubrobacteraceae bacterium]